MLSRRRRAYLLRWRTHPRGCSRWRVAIDSTPIVPTQRRQLVHHRNFWFFGRVRNKGWSAITQDVTSLTITDVIAYFGSYRMAAPLGKYSLLTSSPRRTHKIFDFRHMVCGVSRFSLRYRWTDLVNYTPSWDLNALHTGP